SVRDTFFCRGGDPPILRSTLGPAQTRETGRVLPAPSLSPSALQGGGGEHSGGRRRLPPVCAKPPPQGNREQTSRAREDAGRHRRMAETSGHILKARTLVALGMSDLAPT